MPEFDVQPKSLQDNEKTTLKHVVQDCVFKNKAYLLGPGASESIKSSVVDSFMVGAIQSYNSDVHLAREHPMSGMSSNGPVDYAVINRIHASQVLGVTEVKKEEFLKGLAQNMAPARCGRATTETKTNGRSGRRQRRETTCSLQVVWNCDRLIQVDSFGMYLGRGGRLDVSKEEHPRHS